MHDQKSRLKIKYLENEKSFWDEIKNIFKGISVAKNCFRPESSPLKLHDFSTQRKAKILIYKTQLQQKEYYLNDYDYDLWLWKTNLHVYLILELIIHFKHSRKILQEGFIILADFKGIASQF